MKKLLNLERDATYYWGLFLLMLLPFALVLEFWRFSFCAPSHFPIYLFIYVSGYLLLAKSDFMRRINFLEEEFKKISAQLSGSDSNLPKPEQPTDTLPFME